MVITASISIAFSPWIRGMVRVALRIPYRLLDEQTELDRRWREGPLNHVKLESQVNRWFRKRAADREDKDVNKAAEKVAEEATHQPPRFFLRHRLRSGSRPPPV